MTKLRLCRVLLAVVLAPLIVACGNGGGNGGGGGLDDVAVAGIDPATPATNLLPIPALLEPTLVDGTAHYELQLRHASHDFGKAVVTDTLAYNDESVLGPTMLWNAGDQVSISVSNNIDEATTAHWHGADVPAEADGGPHNRIDPGQTWVAEFPVIQPAATLWYHPHLMGTTAEQVFAGAAGMIIVADENPAGNLLPRTYGLDDIPVVLQDKEFDGAGQLAFELDDSDLGDLNPELTVNGAFDPYVVVPAGPVRLRLLNGSQARIYQLSTSASTMIKIAGDGGYLERPIEIETLQLGPGDRAEIVINLAGGATDLIDADFGRVLELRPDSSLPVAEMPPSRLSTIDRITADEIDHERSFVLDEAGDGRWGINGREMDMMRIDETISFGDTERWTISAEDGVHVFHVHQTQFQVLSVDGEAPPPQDTGWEDSVVVAEGQEVVIAARFNSYKNGPMAPYMFHCHILDHEDLGMMGQFVVS